MSVLLYGCTTLTLTKCLEKKLDRNHTMMLHAVLNKSWKQHSTKQNLPFHKPSNKNMLSTIGEVKSNSWVTYYYELLHTSVGWQAKTYIHQLCTDTGCHLEDLKKVMTNKDEWWGICTVGKPWRWYLHPFKKKHIK